VLALQRPDSDLFVDSVEEFRAEEILHRLPVGFRPIILATAEVALSCRCPGAEVGRHDDDRLTEIGGPA